LDYKSDLKIDQLFLDQNLLEQPLLTMSYSEALSQKQLEADKINERLNVAKAQLDKEIRSNPESFGLAKLTEATISNMILLDPQIQELNSALTDLNYEISILKAAVSAFNHRKKSLELLVQLFIGSYWSLPRENQNRVIEGGKAAKEKNECAETQRSKLNESRIPMEFTLELPPPRQRRGGFNNREGEKD
jgi:hypothetical protein